MHDLSAAQPYEPGTLDRALLDSQSVLSATTRDALYGEPPALPVAGALDRPRLQEIVGSIASAHVQPLARLLALTRWCSRIPRDFPCHENSTASGFYGDFSHFRWGGSEEAVIAKGSPWPQEIARALATLLQMVGIAARLVFLYRAEPPRMHTVVEAWALGGWAVCDACANRCYLWPHHGYASALALQREPRLVDQAPEHGHNRYVDSAFYRTIAIAGYPLSEAAAPDTDLRPARLSQIAALQAAAAVFTAP